MALKTDISGVAPSLEILVVEDNIGDALLLVKYLEGAKVPNHVTMVKDGEEALDLLNKRGTFAQAKRPDLVFLDLNLPRKDGREVLKEIKRDPGLREIPVLVLTTSNWEKDVDQAYESDANLYIVKPADLEQFLVSMKYIEDVWLKTIVPGGK